MSSATVLSRNPITAVAHSPEALVAAARASTRWSLNASRPVLSGLLFSSALECQHLVLDAPRLSMQPLLRFLPVRPLNPCTPFPVCNCASEQTLLMTAPMSIVSFS